jgi:hypothetical protein
MNGFEMSDELSRETFVKKQGILYVEFAYRVVRRCGKLPDRRSRHCNVTGSWEYNVVNNHVIPKPRNIIEAQYIPPRWDER